MCSRYKLATVDHLSVATQVDATTSPAGLVEVERISKEKEDAENAAVQKELEELEKEKQVRCHKCMLRGNMILSPFFFTGTGRDYSWIDSTERRFERACSKE